MKCNIDARGKAVRLLSGLVVTAAAVIVAVVALLAGTSAWWVWLIAGVLLLVGLFQIYEGRTGWCALRAMGFRTPI